MVRSALIGLRLRQRLVDALSKPRRFDGERLDALAEALRGRQPHAVEREDDAHDPHRAVEHPFHQGKALAGSGRW